MKKRHQGFSLVEMMIAVALSSMVSIIALSMFIVQDRNISVDETRGGNINLSETTFNALSRLLRHAVVESINIDYSGGELNSDNTSVPEISNDKIVADFSLPPNYPIWPNDKLPYDKHWVRLQWSNSPQSNKSYSVTIATASSAEGLADAKAGVLTAGEAENLIANLDIWPLDKNGNAQGSAQSPANGGYQLLVTARSTAADPTYQHPRFAEDNPLANFRTHTISGVISPRN